MIGKSANDNTIYIIDFGLSKKYYSTSKQRHIQFCKGKSLIGTARYCARNAHKGYEQSRRDDIESIGYVLIYFLIGSLPWQGLKVKQYEDQFEKIAMKKYNITVSELCRGCPEEFILYFNHVDTLQFEDEPNYEYLIELFQQMIKKYCNDVYYDFDWKQDMGKYNTTVQDIHYKSRDVSLVANKNGLSTTNESRNVPEEKNEVEENGEEKFNLNQHHSDIESTHENVQNNKQIQTILTHNEIEEKKDRTEDKQQCVVGKKNKNFIRNSCLFEKGISNKKGEHYYTKEKDCCCVNHDRDKFERNKEYDNNCNEKYTNNATEKSVICQQFTFNYLDDIYFKKAANLNTARKEQKYLQEKPPISDTNFSNINLQLSRNHSRNRTNNNVIKSTTDPLKDSTKCTCVMF